MLYSRTDGRNLARQSIFRRIVATAERTGSRRRGIPQTELKTQQITRVEKPTHDSVIIRIGRVEARRDRASRDELVVQEEEPVHQPE